MRFKELSLPGCFEIKPIILEDTRGRFIKTFHKPTFLDQGLESPEAEEYYTTSDANVLRGLHFQTPPMDHVKLVYCVSGRVLDVVLDIRLGSPTYGKHVTLELSHEQANMIYIPRGIAHGFCVLEGPATMVYRASEVYSCNHDKGVLWHSAGISWPTQNPVISDRDREFPEFAAFESPFEYAGEQE